MKVLFTGGSGDLGLLLGPSLEREGHDVTNIDPRKPELAYGTCIQGSIQDRELLASVMQQVECVVHIAALHGIHEFRETHNRYAFWDLNVTGTFNMLEEAMSAGVDKFLFISSTSVADLDSFYGQTKSIAETICQNATRRDPKLKILTLRPRAFIPAWNRTVYKSFQEWAAWFWRGAVHVSDVSRAARKGIDFLQEAPPGYWGPIVVDGKHDYSEEELDTWDKDGSGSTFTRRYGSKQRDLIIRHGLDPSIRPRILGHGEASALIGYVPQYGITELMVELEALDHHGDDRNG